MALKPKKPSKQRRDDQRNPLRQPMTMETPALPVIPQANNQQMLVKDLGAKDPLYLALHKDISVPVGWEVMRPK